MWVLALSQPAAPAYQIGPWVLGSSWYCETETNLMAQDWVPLVLASQTARGSSTLVTSQQRHPITPCGKPVSRCQGLRHQPHSPGTWALHTTQSPTVVATKSWMPSAYIHTLPRILMSFSCLADETQSSGTESGLPKVTRLGFSCSTLFLQIKSLYICPPWIALISSNSQIVISQKRILLLVANSNIFGNRHTHKNSSLANIVKLRKSDKFIFLMLL